MHYVINVSQNGKHVFATAEHSLRDEYAARHVYSLMLNKFPASEGYVIDVTLWKATGHRVNFA